MNDDQRLGSTADGALVARLKAGDRSAVDELYRRYRDRVYAVCYRILCGDSAAAEDATQDTFLAVLVRGLGDKPVASLESYLLRMARNKAVDVVRRGGRLDADGNRRPAEQPVAKVPDVPDRSSDDGPEVVVTRLARVDFSRELVNRAFAGLNENDRAKLALYLATFDEGLSPRAVAELLGIDPASVRVVLKRLGERMRDSVVLALLLEQAQYACPELTAIVERGGRQLTPLLRKQVSRHVADCRAGVAGASLCTPHVLHTVSVAELFAVLPLLVVVPATLDRKVMGVLAAVSTPTAAPVLAPAPGVRPGTPPAPAARAPRAGLARLGKAVVVAAGAVLVLSGPPLGPFRAPFAEAGPPGTSPTSTAPPPALGASASPGASLPGGGQSSGPGGPAPVGPGQQVVGSPRWGYARLEKENVEFGRETVLNPQWQWGSWMRDADRAVAGRYSTVLHTGTGRYTVRLPAIGSPRGVAHVGDTVWPIEESIGCQVRDRSTDGVDELVRVSCYDPAGAAKDMRFNVFVAAPSSGTTPMVTVDHTGNGAGTYNSTGGAAGMAHLGTGRYAVDVTGPGIDGSGHTQITPYGAVPARCRPAGSSRINGGIRLSVDCHAVTRSATAQPVDTDWVLSYAQGAGLHHDPTVPAAYVTTTADPANPSIDAAHSWASNGETPTVTRTRPGLYTITYQRLGKPQIYPADSVQVTAVGPQLRTCRNHWLNSYSDPPQVSILVYCFDLSGALADATFAVAYLRAP